MSKNDTNEKGKEEYKKEEKKLDTVRCSHEYSEYVSTGDTYYKCSKCNDVKISGVSFTYKPY